MIKTILAIAEIIPVTEDKELWNELKCNLWIYKIAGNLILRSS